MSTNDNSANNKRIAKNTLLLYVRMLFLMLISLYTSRVILNALGIDNYGIYNVVGGLVSMFSLISASLNASISRFLTFELGKGDRERLKDVFSTSVTIQIALALIVFFIAESVGLWFLNYKMVIPEGRMVAANWCFQFSIVTFVINLISVPYNAAIIAHEKMSAFAYISIIEAASKLIIAWLIVVNPIDRLIFFAAMCAMLSMIIRFVYAAYCKRFEECRYHFYYDHDLFKQMFGFAGWNFIGASSMILRDNGGNILLNLFYGTTANAARGIAASVNSAISGFVNNYMVALDPQIIKSYASENREYMFNLALKGAKFSIYILLLPCLPILLNTNYVLTIWLKIVPEYAVTFVRLVLILTMCEAVSGPLITIMLATGKIRNYQLIVGGIQMLNFPLALICFYIGFPPESIYIIAIVISQCCLAARLFMLHRMVGLDISLYIKKVYINVLLILFISLLIPLLLNLALSESLFRLIIVTTVCLVSTILVEYYVGLTSEERFFVADKVIQFKNKFFSNQ